MSAVSEMECDQEDCLPAVEEIQAAINSDDRIGSNQQPVSRAKSRAREIVEIIGTPGAHRSQETTDQQIMKVCAPGLAENEAFAVGEDTLRNDLNTLTECGYLDVDKSEPPFWYTIADSWGSSTTTEVDIDTSGAASQQSDIDDRRATHETDYVQQGDPLKNYQRVLTLFRAAHANLTPTQQTVASIFGIGGVVVGLFGVLLAISGLSIDPQLVAAGDSSIRAGVAALVGWLWLHFVGLVNAVSDDDVTLSSSAPTSG